MTLVEGAPREPTSFVGRRTELDAIRTMLESGRLESGRLESGRVVTLVAAGGAGKTRLAGQAATELAAQYGDGAWWVDLAEASELNDVVTAVAEALDVAFSAADAGGSLIRAIAGRRMLLVLDNCEQVAADVAAFVDRLSVAGPGIDVLATSRAPLGAAAERVWRVPAMSLDDSLSLFVDRAEYAGAGATNNADARRICDRLDRLPLALELAAGWTTTLTVRQIADSMVQPLELLEGGPHAAPYRHRSMDASVRWSYDLLDDDTRTVFRRLAVFRPTFTADQATAVCAADDLPGARVLLALRRLVDSSLLLADTTGAAARYRMLDVIRAFGESQLDESREGDRVRDRHTEQYRRFVADLTPILQEDKDIWRERVRLEYANVVAAIEWGLQRPDPEPGRDLAAGMAWLWHLESSGHEGMRLLTKAASLGADERSRTQARVLVGLALVADTAVPGAQGYQSARTAKEIANEVGDAATSRLAASLLAIGAIAEDVEEARTAARQAREDALAAGDVFVAEGCAVLLGIVHYLRDEHMSALKLLEPASRTLLERGDRGVAATALAHVALAMARTGRLREAIDRSAQAVEAARPLHDLHRIGLATAVRAEVLAMSGRFDDARAAVVTIENGHSDAAEAPFIPGWERTMARLALWQGRPKDAADWCRREVRWLGDVAADKRLTPETLVVLATALRMSGDEQATSMLTQAADAAERIGLPGLRAAVAEERGHHATDVDVANDEHHKALELRDQNDLLPGCIDSLEAIATVGVRRGTPELSAVLGAAAQEIRTTIGYVARSALLESELRETLANSAYADAVAQGKSLGLEAVAYARRMRGPRGRPDHGWESLTPTELIVVEHAGRGLTNPQIAREMFVSPGTVKTHLAHVYAKLGVANRTDLTRYASGR